MAEPQKLSVFLCHFPADKPVVRELYKYLKKQNWIDPWLDEEKLLPGQHRDAEIEKAANAAHAIIVFLSKGAMTTDGDIHRELTIALDIALEKPPETIFIIPLNVDGCTMPRSLQKLTPVEYFPKKQRATSADKLLESLKVRAGALGISTGEADNLSDKSMPQDNGKNLEQSESTSSFVGLISPAVISKADFPLQSIPFIKNDNFTGREAVLESIQEGFNKNQHTIRKHALTGLGGIGKTQIAVQYSYLHAAEYDLVWWIRAETPASLTADYQALSNALQLDVKTGVEQTVYVNLVNNWLESTDKNWLLIYDNVETREHIEPILARKGHGCILITSQNRDWRGIAQDSGILAFSPEETQAFFAKRLGEKNAIHTDKLAELLGSLPLAMEQACAYMNKRGTPVTSYIRLFEEQRQELWKLETPPKDYKATIATTWQMAFKQIRHSQPVADALLSLWSFFAPDDIPLAMLRSYADQLPVEMAAVVSNPLALEECLAALYGYSLITRDDELISIHRLVQDVVRDSLMNSDALQKWLEAALKILEKAFVYDEYQVATWPLSAPILPHALAVAGYAEKYSIGLELASDIYQKTGQYFREQGEYNKAGKTIQHAIDIRREVLGEKNEKLAVSLDYLGEICLQQAQYSDGLKLIQQAREILAAQSNTQTKFIARNLNNFGWLSHEQGDFENSKKYHEEALAIRRRVVGERHPDTAVTLNSLGVLFYERGDFKNAQKHHEEALFIQNSVLGENHPDIAITLNNLASVLNSQMDFKTALKYLDEALAIQRRILGNDHPNIAITLNNLGEVKIQGYSENALKYSKEALAIRRKTLGENHPDTAISLQNIGVLLVKNSKYVQAKPYLEQALAIYQQVHGTKHHILVRILSNLAFTMSYLGFVSKAQEYTFQAIKICAEAKEPYKECAEIKQLPKVIANIAKTRHK